MRNDAIASEKLKIGREILNSYGEIEPWVLS